MSSMNPRRAGGNGLANTRLYSISFSAISEAPRKIISTAPWTSFPQYHRVTTAHRQLDIIDEKNQTKIFEKQKMN
jgi:hypothetical protein